MSKKIIFVVLFTLLSLSACAMPIEADFSVGGTPYVGRVDYAPTEDGQPTPVPASTTPEPPTLTPIPATVTGAPAKTNTPQPSATASLAPPSATAEPPTATPAPLAGYFVDSSCSLNGNGRGPDCASAAGGMGAYNTIAAAQAGVTGNKAGETLYLRAGRQYTGQYTVNA